MMVMHLNRTCVQVCLAPGMAGAAEHTPAVIFFLFAPVQKHCFRTFVSKTWKLLLVFSCQHGHMKWLILMLQCINLWITHNTDRVKKKVGCPAVCNCWRW